jgi:ATP-dependent DNA helicase
MFRGLFIGIDRYASDAISWLSCAERDASALHSFFADTFGDGGELLTSEQATRAAILGQLDELKGCSEDDFAVIAFSGHGSELHQLVTYDADITNLTGTTIPLSAIGARTRWSSRHSSRFRLRQSESNLTARARGLRALAKFGAIWYSRARVKQHT